MIRLPAILLLPLLLASCFRDDRISSGTGSETTNHLTGIIYEDESTPAAGARVVLVPAGFNPVDDTLPDSLAAVTDAAGAFRLPDPGPGEYRLEVVDPATGSRAWDGDIRHGGGDGELDPLQLREAGHLQVAWPESLGSEGHLFIPGTTFRAEAREGAPARFGPLPRMRVPEVRFTRGPRQPGHPVAKDIPVEPGDTARAGFGEAVLSVDPAAEGAALSETLHGFPLLVRLQGGDFDFPPGADSTLAVLAADGRPLPFEIERWDHAGRRAELWVRLDTLRPGTPKELRLRWGGTAGHLSRSAAPVFDTAEYAGVWHLGGAAGADRRDASGHGRHGKPAGYEGDEEAEGVAGSGDRLDGKDDLLDLGHIDLAGSVTLSAWVRRDTASAPWAAILYKPYEADTLPWKSYAMQYWDEADLPHFEVSEGTTTYGGPLGRTPAGEWRLLHGTWDARAGSLSAWMDGARVATQTAAIPSLHRNLERTLAGATRADGENAFAGVLDEVRIEKVARSAEWIRLSWLSQKPGGKVVTRRK